MIADGTRQAKASSSSRPTKPLKRGKACMNCRFLKIKCDGVKPVCGPCEQHPRDDECEYADGPARSRTKVLEETVSRLEARLLELEKPDGSTPSVTLHDPYGGYASHSKSPPQLSIPESVPMFSGISPFSPTSTTSSLPSGSSGSSTTPINPPPSSNTYLGLEEPPIPTLHASLDKFLPHAQQFGFFLHIPSFYNSAMLAFPLGHASRPTAGLLHAVHLFGVHFSQPEGAHSQESHLLARAVQNVATDLVGSHPNKIIHTLQAEILLAYYFLRTGSLLAAKHRTGAAISLALGCGLHKIRSVNLSARSTIAIVHDQPDPLPLPTSQIEEAERINGFWAVFMLHKFITVALEAPSHVCGALEAPGMQIDTPWPFDMDTFAEGMLHPDLQGNSTVRIFLNAHTADIQPGDPPMVLANKAAILFHRAAHLTGQWSPTMSPRDRMAYDAAARSVNLLIESFRANLMPIHTYEAHHPSIRTILLTHALIDAASIKLHWIFSYAYPASKEICLNAARNMVNYGDLNLHDIGHINPMMGNLWMTACHVLIDEISRVRQTKASWPEPGGAEDELMESYRNGLKAMSLFSQDNVLMRHQLTKVQDAFEAI